MTKLTQTVTSVSCPVIGVIMTGMKWNTLAYQKISDIPYHGDDSNISTGSLHFIPTSEG
jgi:hypothetical protein